MTLCGKARHWRPFSQLTEKLSKITHWLAGGRSAVRAGLCLNPLLTGNFTGKTTRIWSYGADLMTKVFLFRELPAQFPMRNNREISAPIRETIRLNSEWTLRQIAIHNPEFRISNEEPLPAPLQV